MKKLSVILSVAAFAAILSCQDINGQAQQPKGPKSKPVAEWKKQLNSNTYRIMVEKGTEPPFHNAYWNNHEKGVYVSAATGDVLFTSDTKFDSGTGWPSFTKPVSKDKVLLVTDADGERTEVMERSTGLHLGHVFDDGPANKGGKRYCMNSAALKFIKE
ncbi:peptide-methionine (R)-S-oxide reductase MsrB [Mucilaginibacter lacusdianchii]|uniref:peptide-methionine (R)-S-oxide reductase MsrB n=1 Tax=Mucilaginibacter lacusdianchii TaxID=2684211 RepID=UPI00131B573C|nr:peptide-methionine (R)-S-oxide reductase MsrB [Mucilaginibacter sp. JXJ CY 39]